MKTVTFLIHTQQPILATSLQADPNSDISHSYIPGSMIRGMLISRYLRYIGLQNNDDILDNLKLSALATQVKISFLNNLNLLKIFFIFCFLLNQIKYLFFDNTARYLNAYLFDSEKEKRTLPIPISFYKEKGQELRNIWDFSQPAINRPPDSPQRLERGFCLADDSEITIYQAKRRINIHNQRNRQRGRGNEGSGAVFRYDAIDAGQIFQAVVLCDSELDAEILKFLVQPENETEKVNVWLGGSQSAGYGHVTIELWPKQDDRNDKNDWNEVTKGWEDRKERQNNLTVTLLSDTILRDDFGQNTTDTQEFVKIISKALDVELKHIDTYASSTIVGGFNRKWGLPLPQIPALAAGSVFVFKSELLDAQKVENVENQGIGERRVDGFGRIVFNWLIEKHTFSAVEYIESIANHQAEAKPLNSESQKIAERMAERLLRQKLDELLLERLKASTPINSSKISNSQLSRLMIVAKKALTEGKPDPLYELVGRDDNSDNLTKTARTQFKQTEMSDGKKLDEQIRDWLKNTDNWIFLAWGSRPKVENRPGITIAQQSEIMDENNQLSLEYTLRLIIAVTKKMMKDKNND